MGVAGVAGDAALPGATSPERFARGIAVGEALAIIARVAAERQLPVERVSLSRAHGRVLAQDVVATLAQPPFDNSAMDGFTFRHADVDADADVDGADGASLQLVGEQFAGRDLALQVGAGQCTRITTGAPLPQGADTVVMKENTTLHGDRVRIDVLPSRGAYLRHAGEDAAVGDALLQRGDVLTPARVALAASQGLGQLAVGQRPTVAVFSTGDELVEPGLPLAPGQIYNSNREQLMGLLHGDGLDPVAWPTLPDDPDQVTSALRHAGHAFDVVLTCGGVSAGEKDHLPALLQSLGDVVFWKVHMKPGMPILLARGGQLGDALFLCLPGNPVSVLATYLVFARALLDGLQGRRQPRPAFHARLDAAWHKAHARTEFLRGRLQSSADGVLHVQANRADGSHRMRAAADSDVLIELPAGAHDYAAGDVVVVHPY